MGTAYYYLAASLPMLDFNSEPPFSYQSFLENCQGLVRGEDFQAMRQASEGVHADEEVSSNETVAAWQAFEDAFRNEIAWFRANEVNQDPSDHVRGDRSVDPLVVEALAQAAKSSDLFEGERILDQVRWDFLDTLAQGHFFDLEFLIVYAVKLKILERYKEISSRRGRDVFEAYTDFVEQLGVARE